MRKIVSILLSLSILSISLQNSFILTYFKINQSYIAKVLCIEKNIPKSTCEGTCHLNQQLDDSNSSEQNQAPTFLETESLVLFNTTVDESQPFLSNYYDKIFEPNEEIQYFEFVNNHFHPPQHFFI